MLRGSMRLYRNSCLQVLCTQVDGDEEPEVQRESRPLVGAALDDSRGCASCSQPVADQLDHQILDPQSSRYWP